MGNRGSLAHSLNTLRVLEGSTWKLRERVAEGGDALRLHIEATLL